MLAFESAGDLLWRSFPYVVQGAEHERAGRIGAHTKTKRVLPAQDIIDQGPDRMAVARTGEAMRPAPVLQRLRGRPVTVRNLVQHLDRRRYPPAFTHDLSRDDSRCDRAATTTLMLRCDPGLNPAEPRSMIQVQGSCRLPPFEARLRRAPQGEGCGSE